MGTHIKVRQTDYFSCRELFQGCQRDQRDITFCVSLKTYWKRFIVRRFSEDLKTAKILKLIYYVKPVD